MKSEARNDVLDAARAELRAHVGPPLRRLAGTTRALVSDVSAALGVSSTRDVPLDWQWQRIVAGGSLDGLADQVRSGTDGPRVLIAAGYGLNAAKLAFETTVAAALRLRGASPIVMACDASVPACEFNPFGSYDPDPGELAPRRFARGRSALCDRCRTDIRHAFRPLELPHAPLSQHRHPEDRPRAEAYVAPLDFEDYRSTVYRSVGVGEHAFSSLLRTTLRGTLEDDDRTRQLFRRYLISAITYVDMLERLFEAERPERVVAVHGVYLVHGVLCEFARRQGVPVAVWGYPYRQGTVWLSHDDSYHRTLVHEPVDIWENRALTASENAELDEYLESKRGGGRDYITYHPSPQEDRAEIAAALELDPDKPIISLFTNVIWDAQIYYDFNAFESMLDWLFTSIEYFAGRPDLQLVIRVHPAEVKGGLATNQPIIAEVGARFSALPDNVRIIPPESDISSYTLAEMSQAALIYGTKMGLEIAVRGIPVVVAGETFSRGKGFTHDVMSREHYDEILSRIGTLPRNSPDMIQRARRYAHYLYFRRMLDFPLIHAPNPHSTGGARLAFGTLDALLPGRDPALDCVCDGILLGSAFSVDSPSREIPGMEEMVGMNVNGFQN